jgi:hypothetical protein
MDPILLSTAYFPPTHYLSLFKDASEAVIEREENYIKQTYRNRCTISSANGTMNLTVPVLLGSFHKTAIKEIKIDYSRKWQKIHIGAIISSYRAAPYFEYYFDSVEKIILSNHSFLLDINMESLMFLLSSLKIETAVSYSSVFRKEGNDSSDYRSRIVPKKKPGSYSPVFKEYPQVFGNRFEFFPGLSSLDLLFNEGPASALYLP